MNHLRDLATIHLAETFSVERSRLNPLEIEALRMALKKHSESIQDLNQTFPVENTKLKSTLEKILGSRLGSLTREAVLTRMIDSVNLHDDQEMIEEQGIHNEFAVIVLESNEGDFSPEFADTAYCSEIIHVNSDNKMVSSKVKSGSLIFFDASKPHAYLHAANQDTLMLILDFHKA